ncbi:neutral zinc metallopeptidase [Pseudonocardia xinjiangensis]|uniref:neutral zinc metallopeptidase n=1 Tax=Pseudonocardia xinjiangensis TaxID=75289 RepID=UPI003D924417
MRALSRPRPSATAVFAVAMGVLVTGCTQAVPGRPDAARPPVTVSAAPAPSPQAPVPLSPDGVATAATGAIQDVWRGAFPAAFGRPWNDIRTFAPVRTGHPATSRPPCVERVADLVGQAFYCPTADAVVWDADTLLPDLHRRFGSAGVMVALAHEVGHAVQSRLGIDAAQAGDPGRYPAVLLETMADCYAGVVFAELAERPVAGLAVDPKARDAALLALVGFRDPLGVLPGNDSAHGNAFDRVSAFQDGFRDGAARCSGMTVDNRSFTQRRFGSAADQARGGDLPLPVLLEALQQDADQWFGALSPGWRVPPIGGASCPAHVPVTQGPVRFCAADGVLSIDQGALDTLHREVGDYAGATLLASRYGIALLAALGAGTEGPAAGAAAVCLAGAYTGALVEPDGGFTLSPGDLDEAVQVLLTHDWAARDSAGGVDTTESGFDRVSRFRDGLLGGPHGCLPNR